MITEFTQYALECYDIPAFYYLVKPINIKKLENKIDEVRNCINSTPSFGSLQIKTRHSEVYIKYSELLYVESYMRATYAYTRKSCYKFYIKISDLEHELSNKGFYRIHKSYIVNMTHIKTVDRRKSEIILSTGHVLPISSKKINDFSSALAKMRM